MKKTLSIILSLLMMLSVVSAFGMHAFAASAKTVSGTYNYSYASEVLDLVNNERAAYGLKPLKMTESLTDGAMIRAAETTVSFSHTRPNGEKCFTAFNWTSSAGENIAYGQRSPSAVVTAWMNSSGHRANILNSSFTTIGVGCFQYNGILYWSQAFSGGSGTSYYPSGTKAVTVEVSLTPGVQSRVVTGSDITTTKTTTQKITTQKATTVKPSTTKATTKATTKVSTTKATTKPNTTKQTTTKQTTAKPSTTKQTTAKQSTTCTDDNCNKGICLSDLIAKILKMLGIS